MCNFNLIFIKTSDIFSGGYELTFQLLPNPVIKSIFNFHNDLMFFIICFFLFIARTSYCLTSPREDIRNIYLYILIFLLTIGIYIYNKNKEKFSLLFKIQIPSFNKNKKCVKTTELEVNFSYLQDKLTPEVLKYEDTLKRMKQYFWLYLLFVIFLPVEIYQEYFRIVFSGFVYYNLYLYVLNKNIINLKSKLLVEEYEKDMESFLNFKNNILLSNPYIRTQKWGDDFETHYQCFLQENIDISLQKHTSLSSKFSTENFRLYVEELKCSKNKTQLSATIATTILIAIIGEVYAPEDVLYIVTSNTETPTSI